MPLRRWSSIQCCVAVVLLVAMHGAVLSAQQRVERVLATISLAQGFGADLRPFAQEAGLGYAITRTLFVTAAFGRTGSAAVGTEASLLMRARLSPFGMAPYVGAGVMRMSASPSSPRLVLLAGGDLPWRGLRKMHIMAWPFVELRAYSGGPLAAAVHGGLRLMPDLH